MATILILSFKVQNLLNDHFCFMIFDFHSRFKKFLFHPQYYSLLPVCLQKFNLVLTFVSVIFFALRFVSGKKSRSRTFIVLCSHLAVSVLCAERWAFSRVAFASTLLEASWKLMWGLFLDSIQFHWSIWLTAQQSYVVLMNVTFRKSSIK
jgi:hypothetical protein